MHKRSCCLQRPNRVLLIFWRSLPRCKNNSRNNIRCVLGGWSTRGKLNFASAMFTAPSSRIYSRNETTYIDPPELYVQHVNVYQRWNFILASLEFMYTPRKIVTLLLNLQRFYFFPDTFLWRGKITSSAIELCYIFFYNSKKIVNLSIRTLCI